MKREIDKHTYKQNRYILKDLKQETLNIWKEHFRIVITLKK